MKIKEKYGLLILLTFILFTHSINAQTWEEIGFNLPDGQIASANSKITFANKDVGWLFTEFYKGNEYLKKLYRTIDGGENWKEIENLNIAFNGYITLFSTEPDFFYITTSDNAAYTNDGGITWDYVHLSTTFLEIYFLDNKNGIAGGGYSWITSNGGKTWSRKDELSWPRDFYFHNNKLGWAVGYSPFSTDAGYIAKTTDGGNTWVYQDSMTFMQVDYYGVDFIDSLKGFAVGGSVSKTIDGGNNWETISGVNGYDVGFLDDKNGWISTVGDIFYTSDGGHTWAPQLDSLMNYYFIKTMVLKKDKIAYVLGINLSNFNATLLRADLSNITGIEENNETIPNEFHLYQNYPNPFNPSTTISYTLLETGNVQIKIFDVLGREVAKLVDETKNVGKHSVTWNGSNSASGIYFYTITFNHQTLYKKMLMIK